MLVWHQTSAYIDFMSVLCTYVMYINVYVCAYVTFIPVCMSLCEYVYAGIICGLIAIGNISYTLAGLFAATFTSYTVPCAVGFSGVIFGVLLMGQ